MTVVPALVVVEGLLDFINDGLIVAAELFASEFERGEEQLVVVCLELEDQRLIVVVEVGNCLYNQDVVSLVKRIDEGIDALYDLQHEIVVNSAFETTVEVEDAGQLSDVRGHQVLLDANEQPIDDLLAVRQSVSREDLQHIDGNCHLFLREVFCGLDEGHEAVLVAIEVFVREGVVIAEVEQCCQKDLQADFLLFLLQVFLEEL